MRIPCLFLLIVVSATGLQADDSALDSNLKKIRNVSAKGAGHREAIAAWAQVIAVRADQLPQVLAGMDGAEALATNWIRGLVDAIAEREIQAGGKLPVQELEQFIAARQHHPRARRTAYEWLTRVDPSTPKRLLPGMLNDPSLELRRDAVAYLLYSLKPGAGKDVSAKESAEIYRQALTAARDIDQIKLITKELKEQGEAVDLPQHYGFLQRWKLAAWFDNADQKGFDVAYPPERGVDLKATYKGQEGKVSWVDHVAKDEYGIVELNAAIGKKKGAIAYAYAVFVSDRAQEVDLRIGCINAYKVWVNGELLLSREVYHAGMEIDQYIAKTRLRAGENTILVKVCQNEQEESWAQRWQFQLRICDLSGQAILSQDRPAAKTAHLRR